MAARLTRAKRKIVTRRHPVRGARRRRRCPSRLDAVAQTSPTSPSPPATRPAPGPTLLRAELAGEAIRLVRVALELRPDEPVLRGPARADAAPALAPRRPRRRRRRGWCCCPTRTARAGTTTRSTRRSPCSTPMPRRPPPRSPGYASRPWSRPSTPPRRRLATPMGPDRRALRRAGGARPVAGVGSPAPSPSPRRDGPAAGLAALDGLDAALPHSHRLPAVRGELLARAGDAAAAGRGTRPRDRAVRRTTGAAEHLTAADSRLLRRTRDRQAEQGDGADREQRPPPVHAVDADDSPTGHEPQSAAGEHAHEHRQPRRWGRRVVAARRLEPAEHGDEAQRHCTEPTSHQTGRVSHQPRPNGSTPSPNPPSSTDVPIPTPSP